MKRFLAIILVLSLITVSFAGMRDIIRNKMNEISSNMNRLFRILNNYYQQTNAFDVTHSTQYRTDHKVKAGYELNALIENVIDLNELYAQINPSWDIEISTRTR